MLSNLEEGGVLFIDEIHRLSPQMKEILYPAMEPFLMQQGLISRTLWGRVATPLAYSHLGKILPHNESPQGTLLP
ncbi:MAG: hypothetical protein COA61_006240 [Zetaproteobacteria bacterium]|nr:hypothetical protein [Zetaproteobacteria bacterium]